MRGHNRTHQRSDSSKGRSLRLLGKLHAAWSGSSLPWPCKRTTEVSLTCFGLLRLLWLSFTTLCTAPAPSRRRRPNNDMMTEENADGLPKGSSSFARRRRQSIIKLSQKTTPPQQSSSHSVVKLRQLSLQSSSTKHSEAQILIAAEQSPSIPV